MLVSVIFFVFGWVLGHLSSRRCQSESESGRVEGSDSCCDSLLDHIGGNGDDMIC